MTDDRMPSGLRELRPRGPAPETFGPEHPSRPIPDMPPDDPALLAWAEALERAADAWRPELSVLVDELGLRPGSRVLDAGCGPGRVTGWLAGRVLPGGLVNAVDPDVAVLEYAAWALAPLAQAGARIHLGSASVERLPFAASTFDAAWCSAVLGYVDDPAGALAELVRVVRPGGRIVVVSGDAAVTPQLPIDPDLELAVRQAERQGSRARWSGADPYVGRRLVELADGLAVRSVEPRVVTWSRVTPLDTIEHAHLHAALSWLADPSLADLLGDAADAAASLVSGPAGSCLLDRPGRWVVQQARALVISV